MNYDDLYQALLDINVGDVCPNDILVMQRGEWACIERHDSVAATSLVLNDRAAQPDMFLGLPRCWVVVSHISKAKIICSGIYAEADGVVYGRVGRAFDLWQQHRLQQKYGGTT